MGKEENMYAMPEFFALSFLCVFLFFFMTKYYIASVKVIIFFLLNVCLNGYYYMGHICFTFFFCVCVYVSLILKFIFMFRCGGQ